MRSRDPVARLEQPASPGGALAAGSTPDFLHDLANLLTAISGCLELILSRPEDARREGWARNALDAAEQAAQLASKHHLAPRGLLQDLEEHIAIPALQPQTSTVPRRRILVVDDEMSVRRYLAEVLAALGYETLEADGGASAIAMLGDRLPDLFIVDFAMPGMTGAEVALRRLGRVPEARVLFMSGLGDAAAMGAVDPEIPILRKPFRAADLAAAVRGVLDGDPG